MTSIWKIWLIFVLVNINSWRLFWMEELRFLQPINGWELAWTAAGSEYKWSLKNYQQITQNFEPLCNFAFLNWHTVRTEDQFLKQKKCLLTCSVSTTSLRLNATAATHLLVFWLVSTKYETQLTFKFNFFAYKFWTYIFVFDLLRYLKWTGKHGENSYYVISSKLSPNRYWKKIRWAGSPTKFVM